MSKPSSERLRLVALLAVVALLAAGCSSIVDQDQPTSHPGLTLTLTAGHEVGQTFVSQHGGLDGIEFALRNSLGRETTVSLQLKTGPDSDADLAVASVVLPPAETPAYYRFVFPALSESHNRYLYAVLRTAGEVQLDVAPGASYLNGSIYYDGQPADGQARFRAVYGLPLALLELLRAGLQALRILGAGVLFWLLPGWALLRLGIPAATRTRLHFAAQVALAAGLGVALYPVLILWASTLGVQLGSGLYWGPLAFAVGVLAWDARRERGLPAVWRSLAAWRPTCAAVLLFAAVLAVFLTRLLVVRSLDAPSWGDSVQHAVMTQRIFEQRGLFSSWQPYAPYRSLSVQFGFAANAAVAMQWLGISAAQATTITGQLLSGLAALALYPLALKLARGNTWAGLTAVIVAGLLSPMPGFYVNWGRYAQLTGQVVLPAALWLLWEAAERPAFSLRLTAVAGLALAGMMLGYYRMPFYYAAFVLAWLLFWGVGQWRRDVRRWARGLAGLAAIALVGGALVAPWLSRVSGSTLAEGLERGMTRALPVAAVMADYQQWALVTDYVPLALLVGGGLALLWALARRNGRVVMVALWTALMAALVAGRLINLPGANLLQSFAVMILLYMPLSLVLGWLAGELAAGLQARWGRIGPALPGTVLAVLLIWGAASQLKIVKRGFILVTRPDARAMAWIAQNTPPDAVFLVEGFRVYGGGSAVGSDAGWWIPLLTGRANTMPPQYAIMNETPVEPDYSQRVVALVAALETSPPGSDAGLAALCPLGVTHVYVGQTQGATGMGVRQLMAPADLLNDPRFALVYHADRVYVFGFDSQVCKVLAKVAK